MEREYNAEGRESEWQDQWHQHNLVLKILIGPKLNELRGYLGVAFAASQHESSRPELTMVKRVHVGEILAQDGNMWKNWEN